MPGLHDIRSRPCYQMIHVSAGGLDDSFGDNVREYVERHKLTKCHVTINKIVVRLETNSGVVEMGLSGMPIDLYAADSFQISKIFFIGDRFAGKGADLVN
jgi:hypothetical protein